MPPPVGLIKVLDEGSPSPLIARMFFGLLELRGVLYLSSVKPESRAEAQAHFDLRFNPVWEAARATRDAGLEIAGLVARHRNALDDGSAVHLGANQFEIRESIDGPLGQAVDKLIDQGTVAIKSGLQGLLRDPLELDIGFVFKKDAPFRAGLESMASAGENQFAMYLEQVREAWLARFGELRVAHEHEGWTLDPVRYQLAGSRIIVKLPEVLGLPVDRFATLHANRVLLLIENATVYAMRRYCRHPLVVVEIPKELRDDLCPKRFRIAPRGLATSPEWAVAYCDDQEFL